MSNTDRHPECHMRTVLGNCDPIGGFCTSVNESICEALHKVSRPQGEWIALDDTSNGYWKCSVCGTPTEAIGAKELYKFCPFCNADMRGADDGSR